MRLTHTQCCIRRQKGLIINTILVSSLQEEEAVNGEEEETERGTRHCPCHPHWQHIASPGPSTSNGTLRNTRRRERDFSALLSIVKQPFGPMRC
ncbi:hypothetical protein TcWFU_004043 [Taenia crassiceps]|uniref:Uncharacterized protein n=1 Tax=Taenia crassiceps TaxID=6207 RepID=A0ABR4Q677_9CEST